VVPQEPTPPIDIAVPQEPPPGSRRRRKRRRASFRQVTLRELVLSGSPLVLVLLGSALPLGAIHVPVLLAVSVVAILAAVHALLGRGRRITGVPGVFIVIAGLALYTALQAIPIPLTLLTRLSPVAAQVWAHALDPVGQPAPWAASLTLDPGATWVEALKWWTYAAVFIAAGTFGLRYGAKWGAVVIFGVALVVALSTVGHGLLNAGRVFGIYTPTTGGRGWRIGPFINVNSLSGYLNLGLLAGVGVIASAAPPVPRWILSIGVAIVLGVSTTTGSRGGLGALVLALIVLLPMLRRARSAEGAGSSNDRYYTLIALALALVGGVVFAVIAATGKTMHLLADPSVRKLRMIEWAPAMMREFPWFGAGRGAFEGVFPAYKMGDSNTVYGYAENFVVQWVTEWGVPVALLVIVSLAWLLRPAAWGVGRTTAGAGLFAGFVALAVQNIVDLGLEIPGVAVLASAAMGVAWGDGAATREPRGAGGLVPRIMAVMLVLVGVALFAPALAKGTKTLRRDKELVHRALPKAPYTRDELVEFRELLGGAMSRHPAEAYFPRQGALVAMVSHTGNPVPWVQRALERSTISGRTHYLLAVLLARHGVRAQSLLELRYAAEGDEDLTMRAAILALRMTKQQEELLRAVPDGPKGAVMLSALAERLRRSDRDAAYSLFEKAIERNPRAYGARMAIVRMLLDAIEHRQLGSRCAEERRVTCQKAALGQIRALSRALPNDDGPLELAGKLLLVSGRPVQAAALLTSLCPALPKRSKCLWTWIEAADQSGDLQQFNRALKLAEVDGCVTPKNCSKTYITIGDLILRTRGPIAAIAYYRRAATEDPSRASWTRVARVAAAMGSHAESVRALEHASAYGKPSQELQDNLEQERRKALLDSAKKH
jgi:tetratricopeptide (TPR) repeat protein